MLKINLFGPPQVLLDGYLLSGLTRSRQLIALLAYLVLHPGPHLRERLAGLFWPDISDRRAQSNLNNLIWRLRSALEHAATCVASDAVSAWFVAEDVFVDVYAFQALITSDDVHNLAEGAALVQGDLLDGQDSEWCLTLRARFQQDYAQLLLKLLRQQQASGQWAEASQLAQRLIDLEPFDDQAHVLRVEIECQRGRWSEAKRCFHDYEKLWRDELKLTPSMRMQAVLAAYHLFHTPQVVATLVVQLGDPVLELLANAQQARAKYDYDLALNYLVKAGGMLEALPTSRLMPAHLNVLRECDEIYDLLAERRLQAENLDVLARLSDRFADSGAKYDYWSRRTWLYIASDDYSNAVAASESGLVIGSQDDNEQARALLQRLKGIALLQSGCFLDGYQVFASARVCAPDWPLHQLACHINLARTALALGLIKRAECHLEEARRVNDADAPASLSIRLAGCEGIWNLSTGRLTTALQKLDSAMRRAQQVADRNYAWWLANYSARAHVFSGAASRGFRLAAFHYDLAVEAQSFTDQAELAATAAYCLFADNNAPDAAKWAEIAVRVTDDNTIWHYRVLALMRLAQVQLHRDESAHALESIQAAETLFDSQPMSWEFGLELYQTLERVYIHVGDLNAAQCARQKAFQVDAEICRLDEVI